MDNEEFGRMLKDAEQGLPWWVKLFVPYWRYRARIELGKFKIAASAHKDLYITEDTIVKAVEAARDFRSNHPNLKGPSAEVQTAMAMLIAAGMKINDDQTILKELP